MLGWILSLIQSNTPKTTEPYTKSPKRDISPEITEIRTKEAVMQGLIKSTRKIKGLFIHSTATKASRKVTPTDIYQWHVVENKWSAPGYHFLIQRDGTLLVLRDINKNGAHTRGHNVGTIGIVMAGGLSNSHGPEANFTRAQFRTLRKFIAAFNKVYPDRFIKGHRDVAPTACPSFDVQHWLKFDEVKP